MEVITKESVLAALRGVANPRGDGDIVGSNLVSGVVVKDRNVGFTIEIEPREAAMFEPVRRAAEAAVKALPGVSSCTAVLTAERSPPPQLPRGRPEAPAARGEPRALVPDVRTLVAVASGKGGVGKSTTAVNLAMGLAALGERVGLLDADIYGPSLPRMTGISGRPRAEGGRKLLPMVTGNGVKVMSMGFLVEEDAPMIWRGPMVQSALQQMLGDVEWGELDVMVIDLPPGTGDAQLTIAQRVPLSGAVIVSTPQDIALLDARKAINMFRKVNVPILGIIENMSYFSCPHCGGRTEIFAHGGAAACAAQQGVEFLGEIPLDLVIRDTSDRGTPITLAEPASPQAQAYLAVARSVQSALLPERHSKRRGFPRIRFI